MLLATEAKWNHSVQQMLRNICEGTAEPGMKASKELHGASTQGIGLKPISNGCWLREAVLLLQKVLASCYREPTRNNPPTTSTPHPNRIIMAEYTEIPVLENKFVLLCVQCTGVFDLPRDGSCSTGGDSDTKLHSKFLSAAAVCLSPPTLASPNTFGTHPLVFTKLLSFVRRVPQREPIENYIFIQNFQLVKCHQHLHQLEKSNRLSINSFGISSHPSTKFARNLCLSAPSSPEGTQSASFSFYY